MAATTGPIGSAPISAVAATATAQPQASDPDMAIVKPLYSTSTSITITLDSLAGAAARESASLDNSVSLYQDVLVTLNIPLAAGTPGDLSQIIVYAAGCEDGTHFGDNATGTDAGITLRTPSNLRTVAVISTPTAGGLTWRSQPIPIAAAFGGILPRKWSIIVENRTGLAFSTGCTATFTGVNLQTV
jgi:hypothetical protein